MNHHVVAFGKSLPANITLERFLTGVRPDVNREITAETSHKEKSKWRTLSVAILWLTFF